MGGAPSCGSRRVGFSQLGACPEACLSATLRGFPLPWLYAGTLAPPPFDKLSTGFVKVSGGCPV